MTPPTLQQGDEVIISVQGISSVADDNTLTIGGMACVTSNASSSETSPASVVNDPFSITNLTHISCVLPELAPGHYRALLHTSGKGWAFGSLNNSRVEVLSSHGSSTVPSVSLRGGQLVTIAVKGLPVNAIGHTTVTIGNTPCPIQQIVLNSSSPQTGHIYCLTAASLDDGYSAVVRGSALGYWSLQGHKYSPSGSLISTVTTSMSSAGTLGSMADAFIVGTVSIGQMGISGNQITDQSALFDVGYIRIPSLQDIDQLSSFSIELWVKPTTNTPSYRIIASSHNTSNGITRGFLLMLNPCNQLEYWLATGEEPSSVPVDCYILGNTSSGCNCSGRLVYSSDPTLSHQLPQGAWNILTGPLLNASDQTWTHVVFGFNSFDAAPSGNSSGTQVLYVNGTPFESHTVHHRVNGTTIEVGGSSALPLSSTGNSQLGHFTGYIDEVSLFGRMLSQDEVATHYHYGTTDQQPIRVETDARDGLGRGSVPNLSFEEYHVVFNSTEVSIDWDTTTAGEHEVNEGNAIHFHWTG